MSRKALKNRLGWAAAAFSLLGWIGPAAAEVTTAFEYLPRESREVQRLRQLELQDVDVEILFSQDKFLGMLEEMYVEGEAMADLWDEVFSLFDFDVEPRWKTDVVEEMAAALAGLYDVEQARLFVVSRGLRDEVTERRLEFFEGFEYRHLNQWLREQIFPALIEQVNANEEFCFYVLPTVVCARFEGRGVLMAHNVPRRRADEIMAHLGRTEFRFPTAAVE